MNPHQLTLHVIPHPQYHSDTNGAKDTLFPLDIPAPALYNHPDSTLRHTSINPMTEIITMKKNKSHNHIHHWLKTIIYGEILAVFPL